MDWLVSFLEKRLAKKKQEVIKLRWKKAKLESLLKEKENKK